MTVVFGYRVEGEEGLRASAGQVVSLIASAQILNTRKNKLVLKKINKKNILSDFFFFSLLGMWFINLLPVMTI